MRFRIAVVVGFGVFSHLRQRDIAHLDIHAPVAAPDKVAAIDIGEMKGKKHMGAVDHVIADAPVRIVLHAVKDAGEHLRDHRFAQLVLDLRFCLRDGRRSLQERDTSNHHNYSADKEGSLPAGDDYAHREDNRAQHEDRLPLSARRPARGDGPLQLRLRYLTFRPVGGAVRQTAASPGRGRPLPLFCAGLIFEIHARLLSSPQHPSRFPTGGRAAQNCTFTSSRLASSASKNSRGLRPLANRLSGNTAMAAL